MNESIFHPVLYFLLYSFLGWVGETICLAVRDRHFVNRGILNLPLLLSHGLAAVMLIVALEELDNMGLQLLMCLIVFYTTQALGRHVMERIGGNGRTAAKYVRELSPLPKAAVYILVAGIYLAVYLVVHPLVHTALSLVPNTLCKWIALVGVLWVTADLLCVLYSVRSGRLSVSAERRMASTERLTLRIALPIRDRLSKAYPGILTPDPTDDGDHTFARGLCFDKLVWVFLISSFLGALIEMVYCHSIDGFWMNRSSLLYGSFSVVWGLGAVVLTVTLQRVADKADRWVFLAGFFIGGAYEYLCSVFTELVFGTVFWDYSNMPLNIGGRTNVMYCLFWGVLAVVWVKILYPKLSRIIELIPAVAGKLSTWIIVLLMCCNCLLTAAAMIRYDVRADIPTPRSALEQLLDERYDDGWMEARWPNMARK